MPFGEGGERPGIRNVGTLHEAEHPPGLPFAPEDVLAEMPTAREARRAKKKEARRNQRTRTLSYSSGAS